MYISRLQVEEGFLNGLDLEFSSGLNVIIGARGTGKTSVVELIRFTLGLSGYTPESIKRSQEHAKSVLGSGQATVTFRDRSRTHVISRSADDPQPRLDALKLPRVTVVSQSEIEQVGLVPSAQLQILDSFITARHQFAKSEEDLVAIARSITADIRGIGNKLSDLVERLSEEAALSENLRSALSQEAQLTSQSHLADRKRARLGYLDEQLSNVAIRSEYLAEIDGALGSWLAHIDDAATGLGLSQSWFGEGEDPAKEVRRLVSNAASSIVTASHVVRSAGEILTSQLEQIQMERVVLEDEARSLRKEIESLQEGAGMISRTISVLRERLARIASQKTTAERFRNEIFALQADRSRLLDRLEELRHARFVERCEAAQNLNRLLGPRIHVRVTRAGDASQYVRHLMEALRGSGLRYNDLAHQIAHSIPPRELLDLVEAGGYETVSQHLGISQERATRLVNALRDSELGTIATCLLEDTVTYLLLDGGDYKDLSSISTGQRCTVILSLLLSHDNRILVFDQPEDHIDNAFIAETVISSLNMHRESQKIISTHNANIPVLGHADLVIQMASDGRRGFVKNAAPLDSHESIHGITTLMEGGRRAFAQRAAIYGKFDAKQK